MTTDLDVLVARLRADAKALYAEYDAKFPTWTTKQATANMEESAADALLALREERDAARGDFERAELARARAEAERDAALPLARFGLACLDVSRKNLGDLEGGWVQDKGTELGALTSVEVTEPCCLENCVCAEYGFPCLCYRDSEATKAFRVLDACPEPAGEEGQDG